MSELEIGFWLIFILHCYMMAGIMYVIFDYIPWVYTEAENQTNVTSAIYTKLAVRTLYGWPKLAYEDIKIFFQVRKHNRELNRKRYEEL